MVVKRTLFRSNVSEEHLAKVYPKRNLKRAFGSFRDLAPLQFSAPDSLLSLVNELVLMFCILRWLYSYNSAYKVHGMSHLPLSKEINNCNVDSTL